MKISIIAPDLSGNIAGRSFSLAKCLQPCHEVEIIGPTFGDDVWEPIRCDFDYTVVPGRDMPEFLLSIRTIVNKIDSDFIIISTQRFTSLIPGIIASKIQNTPYLLDIVDLELNEEIPLTEKLLRFLRGVRHPKSYTYTYPCQKLARKIENVTVVSSTLQSEFSGTMVPQVRDGDQMNPELFDKEELRSKYNLSNDKVVLFLGTPQPYKGITNLVHAFENLDPNNKHLLLVGSKDSELVDREDISQNSQISILGPQPFDKIPKFYAIADVVAVPQKDTPKAQAQMPAKIIDAMAMATPVISTKVADIETVIGDGGLVVSPGDESEITSALEQVLTNPDLRNKMGENGRERFENKYSSEVVRENILEIINQIRSGS